MISPLVMNLSWSTAPQSVIADDTPLSLSTNKISWKVGPNYQLFCLQSKVMGYIKGEHVV